MACKMCDCDDWKKYIPLVDGALTMQQIRYNRVYDMKVFVYCPYCGKKLDEVDNNG